MGGGDSCLSSFSLFTPFPKCLTVCYFYGTETRDPEKQTKNRGDANLLEWNFSSLNLFLSDITSYFQAWFHLTITCLGNTQV